MARSHRRHIGLLVTTGRNQNPAQGRLFEHAPQHIWQKRFYDFKIWTERKRVEKLRYMHRIPMECGLMESPNCGAGAISRAYSFGEAVPVAVNAWEVLKMRARPPVR